MKDKTITETTELTTEESCYREINKSIITIEKICRANNIPLFVTYVDPKSGEYVSKVITPKSLDIDLNEDKISKFNLALNNDFSIIIKDNSPKSYAGDLMGSIIDEL